MMKQVFLTLILVLSFSNLFAQKEIKEGDSLKPYVLGEIITTAESEKKIITGDVKRIPYISIRNQDAFTLAESAILMPSVQVQTNSRGETLLFLRGAGERQVGIFLDGVLLNIPWDNRVDLSLVPSDIIGGMTVSEGAGSLLYGANTLGGTINISTIERASEGFGGNFRYQGNDAGSHEISATGTGRINKFNYIANLSYMDSPGFLLSSEQVGLADQINQSTSSNLRSNTQSSRFSTYLRGEYKLQEQTSIGISYLRMNSEKGIAPIINDESARYWKYPEWLRNLFIVNLNHKIKSIDDLSFKTTFWVDDFSQTIDSYKDFTYNEMKEKQVDEDKNLGFRTSLDYKMNKNHGLIVSASVLKTEHNETITISDSTYSEFQQNIFSIGSEYKGVFGDLVLNLGLSYDAVKYPKTGVFTENKDSKDGAAGLFAGLRYNMDNDFALFTNMSRRTRFATMRESYSGALGSFIPNPELKHESGMIYELGMMKKNSDYSLKVTAFYSDYKDLIDQIKIKVDDKKVKKRVNFADALVTGFETSFGLYVFHPFTIEGHFTYMYSEGELDGDYVRHMEYKPDYIGLLKAKYKLMNSFKAQIEWEMTGSQWGEEVVSSEKTELKATNSINLRLSYGFDSFLKTRGEVFLRANNIFDETIYSKWGLPNAGRTISWGIIYNI